MVPLFRDFRFVVWNVSSLQSYKNVYVWYNKTNMWKFHFKAFTLEIAKILLSLGGGHGHPWGRVIIWGEGVFSILLSSHLCIIMLLLCYFDKLISYCVYNSTMICWEYGNMSQTFFPPFYGRFTRGRYHNQEKDFVQFAVRIWGVGQNFCTDRSALAAY